MKKGILLTVFGVVVVSFIGCAGALTWKSFVRNHTIKVEETPEKVESSTDNIKVRFKLYATHEKQPPIFLRGIYREEKICLYLAEPADFAVNYAIAIGSIF